ncbi:hypothetical protein ABH924_004355 [Arthrobacter sp. GAS37]|uniref:hypothetical protein n=1 Tax=Arthrobacter sp. GAS37 TaxID=3156261 RepID=UPI003836F733
MTTEPNLIDLDHRHGHSRDERQASVLAVFGFDTVTTAARRQETIWNTNHPEEPLHFDALLHGLRADMNEALPEPFKIQTSAARYITGPDLAHLPIGWAVTARAKFHAMDLHLDTYTEANVNAWLAQGNDGYPWPPATGTTPDQPKDQS